MFSIGFLTLDIIILIALCVACVFLSMSRGEHILARLIIVFYPTLLIYSNLPYITVTGAFAKIATFIGVFIGVHILLARNITARRAYTNGKKIFDAALLTVGVMSILLTLYYHILPIASLYSLTIPFSKLFTTTLPFGVWLIIPLICLMLANRGNHG